MQLKKRGYTNIDALDGSEEMLKQAKTKGIYKNFYKAYLGPSPIEGIEKGKNHKHTAIVYNYSSLRKNRTLVFSKLFCKYVFQKDHASYQTVGLGTQKYKKVKKLKCRTAQ